MRIAVCALSAVLLSGCSWLGMGGQGSSSNGHSGYYGANCGGDQGGAYGHQAGYAGGAGCGPAGGYGAGYGAYGSGQSAGAGYGGSAGYGQAGYGAGYGSGVSGFQGAYGGANGLGGAGYGQAGYSQAGYGAGGATTLGASAPYGAGLGGAYGGNVVASQYGNGQVVAGGVQTVQGAPVYVNQPYPVPCGYAQNCGTQLRGTGGAMPFGFEVFGGADFAVGGDIFNGKEASPNANDFASATAEIVAPAISYKDAFKDGYNIGGAMTYDISRNTTLLGQVAYQKNEGRTFANGTFQPGSYDASGAFTPGGPIEDVSTTTTDLEQVSIEGGIRRYMGGWGQGGGLRPYVGASGGFTHNNSVDVTNSSSGGSLDPTNPGNTYKYVDSGWTPTAAGIIGAEMAVGNRAAIGVESGIRWRDNLDTNVGSDDRWSIPVQLRGRVSF